MTPAPEDFPLVVDGAILRSPKQYKGGDWVRVRDLVFTEEVGFRVCDHIAEGGTLKDFCTKEGLPRSIIYAWLKDPENSLEGREFNEAYQESMNDRARSWMDDALADAEATPTTGRKSDLVEIRKADQMARLKITLAKETLTKKGSNTGSGAPRVFITTFQEVEEE